MKSQHKITKWLEVDYKSLTTTEKPQGEIDYMKPEIKENRERIM